jgi:transcriptional regulator with XRE-family HTH domain
VGESDFTKALGRRIRERREHLCLTQNAVARALNISFQAVSKWERGENAPELTAIPELADLLGVSSDWLLGSDSSEFALASPAFEGLTPAALNTLIEYCDRKPRESGERIYTMQPGAHDYLYLVESGRVAIYKGQPPDDARRIALCAPGDFFCDYSFFDPAACVTEARVIEAGFILELHRRRFELFQHERPAIALHVLQNEMRKAVRYFREVE